MKNIIYLIIAVAIAALAYNFLGKSNAPEPSSASSAVSEPSTQNEGYASELVQAKDEMEAKLNDAVAQREAVLAADLISKAPRDAAVFIMEPGDGATVSSPVTVKFGITNMTVAKAGENVENSGHHHLLINMETLPSMSAPLPATDQLIHFGGAQTETTIELEPGQHTLQLLLGNYLHIPHDEPVISKKITITVE